MKPSHDTTHVCAYCREEISFSPDRISSTTTTLSFSPSDTYREDSYPDLQRLKSSADAGCKLCGLLRRVALSKQTARVFCDQGLDICLPSKLRMHLQYTFWSVGATMDRMVDGRLATPQPSTENLPGGLQLVIVLASEVGLCDNEWYPQAVLDKHFHLFSRLSQAKCSINLPITCDPGSLRTSEAPTDSNINVRLAPPFRPSALDQEPIKFIKGAIQHCIRNCDTHGCETFLPARLIDVRSQIAKVVNSTELSASDKFEMRYMTLSYCWGDGSQLKLESSSKKWLLSGFSLLDMTPVQRDTVNLARALRIPYVWIDALCIFQDDLQDWRHESTRMGQIYSNAYLNVCAVSSASCHEGFLQRDATRVHLPIPDIRNGQHPFYVVQPFWSTTFDAALTSEIATAITGSLWSCRSWTYQEMILAKRSLLFTKSGLYFTCSNMWCSEYLGWVNSVTRVSDTTGTLASRSIVRDDFDTLPSQENCHLAWAKVIAGYSLREATFSSDLLPALSGLARLFSSAARSNYIAGMWESELYRELMWRIQPPYEQPFAVPSSLNSLVDSLSSQSPFVAPSWSWVGRKQAITPCSEWEECGLPDFGGGNVSRPRYTLLKATVTPEAEDEFGRISNAVLSLETHAFLLGFDFEKDPEDAMLRWGRSKDSFYNLYIDGRDGPRLRLMLDWLPPEVEWDPSQEKEVMSGLMLALIGSSIVSEAYSDHPSEVERQQEQENLERPFGLVLYCDPRSGRYLRVGVFAVATAALNVAYELPYVKFFEGCELKMFEIV